MVQRRLIWSLIAQKDRNNIFKIGLKEPAPKFMLINCVFSIHQLKAEIISLVNAEYNEPKLLQLLELINNSNKSYTINNQLTSKVAEPAAKYEPHPPYTKGKENNS